MAMTRNCNPEFRDWQRLNPGITKISKNCTFLRIK